MQRDFFQQAVFAYISGGAICLFALILAWQHPNFLSFNLVVLISIIVVLMVTTLLRGLAIQESLEAQDDRLQFDAELAHQLSDLSQNILPLWNSHVEIVKTQSEQSVHQLIMSFSCMVRGAAAIEATRVGIQERGFAVVADEVRKLSQLPAEARKRMGERVNHIFEVMQIALSATNRSAIQDKRALEVSDAAVRDVLSHVETMDDAAQQMRPHGNMIRSDSEDLSATLPFQDSTSQILRVVKNDITKLEKTASEFNNGNFPETATWLDELKNTYTMHDEHRSHDSGGAAAINNDSEITFF